MLLNLGLKLPEDDSLSLLIAITEEMDYRELHVTFVSEKGCRKSKLQKDIEELEEYQPGKTRCSQGYSYTKLRMNRSIQSEGILEAMGLIGVSLNALFSNKTSLR